MKDSKEKEHRISNLKGMIDNVKEDEKNSNYEDIEEDEELIEYLNENPEKDYEELEIDDEFIYHPGDEDVDAVNLDENIDEDFIIKTPKVEEEEEDEYSEDFIGEISENFDTVINAKIGGRPILGIVSVILGAILVILSLFIFDSRTERVIDNVVAGETSFMFIIFLAAGILLLCYGVYKVFNVKNPFEHITSDIDSIEDDDKNKKDTKKPENEKPSPKVVPKSKIPLDKDSYKVGEFDLKDLKKSLKKPADSNKKEKPKKDIEDIENIPPAKEKSEEKKGLTSEEIEEMEYEQAKLDNESIDDIFAEVEDIEDIPIISIDSKEEEEK